MNTQNWCFIMFIQRELATELQKHALKGALVENLVVLELFKQRYNLGKSPNLYFFRDSHHCEVDLVYKNANELIPIEVKSSHTFNPRFLKGLKYFQALAPERIKTGYLLYNGDIEQPIQGFQLLNILYLSKIFTSIF